MVRQPEFFTLSEPLIVDLENDLQNLLGSFSAADSKKTALAHLLISKYSENHRAYHNLSHVHALLGQAENFKNRFVDYEAARLAVWFHDAIYEPQSQTNEIESARLAV